MKLRGRIKDLSKGTIQKEIARALKIEKEEKAKGAEVKTYISARYIKKAKEYKLAIPLSFRAIPPRKMPGFHGVTK